MAKQSNFSRIAGQMAVLSDLMHGDGAEAFALLTGNAQAEVRALFTALNDELQAEVHRHG